MKQIKRDDKGFTLVELVVVIAILVVLAALLVPRIMGNVQDTNEAQQEADVRTIASEISTYNAKQVAEGKNPIAATSGERAVDIDDVSLASGRPTTEIPTDIFNEFTIMVDDKGNVRVTETTTP